MKASSKLLVLYTYVGLVLRPYNIFKYFILLHILSRSRRQSSRQEPTGNGTGSAKTTLVVLVTNVLNTLDAYCSAV